MTIETPNADIQGGNVAPPNETPSSGWWIDEGVPGVGDKPTWLGDKFKTVGDLAKSYQELEKRVGNAPEEYDFSKSRYLDADYVPFQELQDFAKTKKIPQEFMDKVIESVDKYFDEFSTDFTEEKQKFGDNANERLNVLNNWAKANLSESSFNALTTHLRTADSLKALEEIRNKMMSNNTVVPNGNDAGTSSNASLDDLQQELNNNLDKYKTDPKYRRDLQAKMEAAGKQSSFVDKNW